MCYQTRHAAITTIGLSTSTAQKKPTEPSRISTMSTVSLKKMKRSSLTNYILTVSAVTTRFSAFLRTPVSTRFKRLIEIWL
jgi:hypothetical protein